MRESRKDGELTFERPQRFHALRELKVAALTMGEPGPFLVSGIFR